MSAETGPNLGIVRQLNGAEVRLDSLRAASSLGLISGHDLAIQTQRILKTTPYSEFLLVKEALKRSGATG